MTITEKPIFIQLDPQDGQLVAASVQLVALILTDLDVNVALTMIRPDLSTRLSMIAGMAVGAKTPAEFQEGNLDDQFENLKEKLVGLVSLSATIFKQTNPEIKPEIIDDFVAGFKKRISSGDRY